MDGIEKREVRIEAKIDGIQGKLRKIKAENKNLIEENLKLNQRIEILKREIWKKKLVIHEIEKILKCTM